MSIIYTVLSKPEVYRLRERDHSFFKQKLNERCLLNTILHKPVRKQLLAELEYLLDRKPIPRQKCRPSLNGKVVVRKVSAEEMERLWK